MKNFRFFINVSFFVFAVFSCSSESVLQEIIGKNREPPVFLGCQPLSSTEIKFRFSHSVRVLSLAFNPPLETESIGDGDEVIISFTRPLDEGMKITADIIVENADRNTLNVIVPFRARNDRMPVMVFNELRTEYSRPRAEFVEFFVLEPGNLGALRLFIASNSLTKPVYEFAPTEVGRGEYIVLHLRTVEEGTVDETGSDLSLSGGSEARNDARDLWVPGTSKLLRRNDALWIVDQDDRIIDAVLLSENPTAPWSNNNVAEAAEFLVRANAWTLPAVNTTGTTNTRTINRDESLTPERRAENWYVTATSSHTPGRANSTRRHGQ